LPAQPSEKPKTAGIWRGQRGQTRLESAGRIVWSFDIARPGTRDITEILVDAKTGKIISTQTESPRDQAKEAAADKKR